MPVAFRIMKATMQPTMGPSSKGSWLQKPFKYTEKRMVANKVVRDMTQAIFSARAVADSATSGIAVASRRAFAARVRPMAMAMGPVTVAGRILLMESLPKRLTMSPAAMETRPDMTMPNWATAIFSLRE